MRNFKLNLGTITKNLDVIAGVLCALLGVMIIGLCYVTGLRQTDIGFTVLLSSLLYFYVRKTLQKKSPVSYQTNRAASLILSIVFLILVSASLFLYSMNLYQRTPLYFITIALLAGVISIEIVYKREKDSSWLILMKIFFLSLIVRYGIFYNYPSIMGYDAYWHVKMADLTTFQSHIPPFEIINKYYYYPILHLFIAMSKLIFGIEIKNAVFLSIGFSGILALMFIYYIGKSIASKQVGLMAALLASLSNQLIVTGLTNITPGSLVLVYLLIVLCLLLKKDTETPQTTLLRIVLALLIIITHQLTSLVVFLSLTSLCIGKFIYKILYKDREGISINYLLIFAFSMITYWMYTYIQLDKTIFDKGVFELAKMLQHGGEYGSNSLIVGIDYNKSLWEETILHLSYLITPFWAIGGIFLWLSSPSNKKFGVLAPAIILNILVYAVPLLGIRSLLTDRWMPLVTIFLVITAGAYICKISELFKSHWLKILTLLAITVSFSFLNVITPAINKDCPFVMKETTVRNQFKKSEICAVEMIHGIYQGQVNVDIPYLEAFVYYQPVDYFLKADLKSVFKAFSSSYISTNSLDEKGVMIVLRKSTLNEPISIDNSDLYGDVRAQLLPAVFMNRFESSGYNFIYNNGEVRSYSTK
jgi:hypothetical protein